MAGLTEVFSDAVDLQNVIILFMCSCGTERLDKILILNAEVLWVSEQSKNMWPIPKRC